MRDHARSVFLVMVLFTNPATAAADLVWRAPATLNLHQHGPAPEAPPPDSSVTAKRKGGNQSSHGRHRRPETLNLHGSAGAQLSMWRSDLQRVELKADNDALVVRPTGVDNYHAVVAERTQGNLHESAIRYLYLNGKPAGRSPAELVAIDKLPLEIVPAPLVREHQRYLSDRIANYQLHYRGQPLANTPVRLETSNGTQADLTTDGEGRIELRLPEDFTHIEIGRRNNPPADFVLRARHTENGKEYRTSLSAPYYVNPQHWQSNSAGLAAALSGFAVGLGILGLTRRREATPTKGVTS
ncbi:MAG: hypothetical protein DWQ09_17605 [Proteobacteria bacterium]|nr:MAG: hypothetical protein DWQ09_17605 [Pseudomonadota bacterium]